MRKHQYITVYHWSGLVQFYLEVPGEDVKSPAMERWACAICFPHSGCAEAMDHTIRVSIPGRGKRSVLQNFCTGSGTHPSYYLVLTRDYCRRRCNGYSLKLTVHFHVAPKLRINGALPVLSLRFTVGGPLLYFIHFNV